MGFHVPFAYDFQRMRCIRNEEILEISFHWSLPWLTFVMLTYLCSIPFKSESHLPEKLFYLLQWKPFKNDEKRFLFHLNSSFHSQDIWIFVLNSRPYRKNGLTWKIRLISNFMTSQPGQQTIALNRVKVRVFFGKNIKKSTCPVMIRIIITFGNQIFL